MGVRPAPCANFGWKVQVLTLDRGVDESLGTSVVADSDRATKGIAKQLSSFFAKQGWTQ